MASELLDRAKSSAVATVATRHPKALLTLLLLALLVASGDTAAALEFESTSVVDVSSGP